MAATGEQISPGYEEFKTHGCPPARFAAQSLEQITIENASLLRGDLPANPRREFAAARPRLLLCNKLKAKILKKISAMAAMRKALGIAFSDLPCPYLAKILE